jgi:hypothetical protein
MEDVHSELNDILIQTEYKLNGFLENSLAGKELSNEEQSIIIGAASDLRAELSNAIDCSKNMFESNMQCLSSILLLKKEKDEIEKYYMNCNEVFRI